MQEIRTDPVSITVTSVVPEGVDYTEPKDIAPPMSLPQPGWPLWVWAAIGVAAGVLAAALIWRRRRRALRLRGRSRPPRGARRARSPRGGAGGRSPIETFYVRLSAILRRYLGWRFGLRAR